MSHVSLEVARSNVACLQHGGTACSLNYEKASNHVIMVQSIDNGSPQLSINTSFTIYISDVNDKPRAIHLSDHTISEHAAPGALLGTLTATDEDSGQVLTYYLSDDDNGLFRASNDGNVYVVNSTDFEKSKTHRITAGVKDDGNPNLKVKSLAFRSK